jgi:succinate dehydrogenase subunit C
VSGPDPRGRPRWHRERAPIFWWLGKRSYVAFIVRELTSLFVAYAAVLLLLQLRALATGAEATLRFEEWLRAPWTRAWHGFVLLMLVYHAGTWFNLAPQALAVRVGGKRVPNAAILAAHYAAWAAFSAAAFLLLAGGAP